MSPDNIHTVGVLGAGTMGNGIAHVFARSGYKVLLRDIDQRFLDRALETISKNLDPASLHLWQNSLDGDLKTTVDFAFTLADADNSEYLHVTLWDTGVSGFSMSSGGDRPSESISLNFAKIQIKDMSKKSDGTAGDQLAVVYDLAKQSTKV